MLQFLDLKSLYNCSLVNSILLFHCMNKNSIYYLNLNKKLVETLRDFDYWQRLPRIWKRLTHVTNMQISLTDVFLVSNFWSKLNDVKWIKVLKIWVDTKQLRLITSPEFGSTNKEMSQTLISSFTYLREKQA